MHLLAFALLVFFSILLEGGGVSSTDIILSREQIQCPSKDFCPKLTCGNTEIDVSMDLGQLKNMKVDTNNINLRDSECKASITNDTVYVKWPLRERVCGTVLRKNGTHVTYKNIIYLNPDEDFVIVREVVNVNVSCTYPLDMVTSLGTVLWPILRVIYISVEGAGQFQVIMTLYKDASYLKPYQENEVVLSTKAVLYVGVFIANGDNQFMMVMKNCFATPRNNINDPVKYYIIKDGCPNKQDGTVQVTANGISNQGQFSVQMFKFIGAYRRVYLHCEIYLCHTSSPSCAPDCTGRKSGRNIPETQGILSFGPIDNAGKVIYLSSLTIFSFIFLIISFN